MSTFHACFAMPLRKWLNDNSSRLGDTTLATIAGRRLHRADGLVTAVSRFGTNGDLMLLEQRSYDNAGRLTSLLDAATNQTDYFRTTETDGSRTHTTLYVTNAQEGIRVIETYRRDGTLQRLTGSGVHGVRYEYGASTNGGTFRKEIKLAADGSDASEWVQHFLDGAGQEYLTLYPDNAQAWTGYDTAGRVIWRVDPDGVTTRFAYNALGQRELAGLDVDRDGRLNGVGCSFHGVDRITRTADSYVTNSGQYYHRTVTSVWPTNNSEFPVVLAATDSRVDGRHTVRFENGVTNETWLSFDPTNAGLRFQTNLAPDGTRTLSQFQDGKLVYTETSQANLGVLRWTRHGYDPHGRRTTVEDARAGTTTYGFDNLDRVTSVTTPAPVGGQSAQTTSYAYDCRGHLSQVTQPDNTIVTNEFWPTGEPKKTVGSRTYPVAYTYDYAGRLKTLTTWRHYPDTGAATTTWNYDAQRGWLSGKTYQSTNGPSYTVTVRRSRVGARRVGSLHGVERTG